MKKIRFTKQILSLALCLIMVLGLIPMTANAAVEEVGLPYAEAFAASTQSGNNTSVIFFEVTDENAATASLYKTSPSSTTFEFTLVLDDGWYFDGWNTYFSGKIDIKWAEDEEVESTNPTDENGNCTFWNTLRQGPINNQKKSIIVDPLENQYGTYKVNAIFKPIVTVNAGDGVSYHLTTNSPTTISGNQTAVGYKDDVTISYIIDNKYVLTAVNASGTKSIDIDKMNSIVKLNDTEKPTSVGIHTRLKHQKVNFNGNGGNGNMTAQVFEHSTAQVLATNSFTRSGYTFAGWNTDANGGGTSYSDKQSVSFAPANDGDSITLYAQWKKLPDSQISTAPTANSLTYNGGAQALVTAGSAYGGELQYSLDNVNWSAAIPTGTDAGDYTVYYYAKGDANHSNSAVSSVPVRIEQATPTTADFDYTAPENLHYDGTEKKSSVTVKNGISGMGSFTINYYKDAALTEKLNSVPINVGTYYVTLDVEEGKNYQAASEIRLSSFAVEKATPSYTNPTAQNTITYGAKLSAVGLPDGWSWSDGEAIPAVINNGYVAYYIPTDTTNYDWAGVEGWNTADQRVERIVAVTVEKATLTVTANDKTITYGDAPANNGVRYSGFVNNETETVLDGAIGYDYTCAQYDNAGTYSITPKGLTSDNYSIAFESGTLTVEKKEIGIDWSNTELTYNGTPQKPKATATNTVSGDIITLTVNGEQINASDEYTAAVTGISGEKSGSYKLPGNVTEEFAIRKATPNLGTVSVVGVVKDTTAPADVVLTQTGSVAGKLEITDSEMLADKSEYNYSFTPNDSTNYKIVAGTVQIDVLDTVAPTVTIRVAANEWKEALNTITFGLFFKNSQEVTITYADSENGSGLKDTLYFVSDKELTADRLNSVEWKVYNGVFNIDSDGKFIIYAKAADNDGNGIISNSDGIVLDQTVAAVEGIANNATYYGDTTITVNDVLAGVKEIKVDNTIVTLTDGKYTITADNKEHTIVVTDNAENITTYTVTVLKNYTVTYKVDGEVLSSEIVGHGKDATLPTIPAKEGYTGKWDHDGKNITADTVINAVYTDNSVVVPGESQPPQTGDNSNITLWVALLFISGVGLFVITLYKRKTKMATKR